MNQQPVKLATANLVTFKGEVYRMLQTHGALSEDMQWDAQSLETHQRIFVRASEVQHVFVVGEVWSPKWTDKIQITVTGVYYAAVSFETSSGQEIIFEAIHAYKTLKKVEECHEW